MNLEKLGFAYEMLKQWRKVIEQPNGIVLVTGPTGSGKSTTLYSVLKELNSDDVNICTVEDPVEFNLPGVNQFQVNEKIGFTFATALRRLLRQDPDIIMVGEIRDQRDRPHRRAGRPHRATWCFSTLHTNDAPGAITRLLNIGVEPYLVAASRDGRAGPAAGAEDLHPLQGAVRAAGQHPPRWWSGSVGRVETFYRGAGCPKCRNTGYSGRIGIYELLDARRRPARQDHRRAQRQRAARAGRQVRA